MAQVSELVGPEQLAKANEGLAQLDKAMAEAKLAVQAGIADQSIVQEIQAQINRILQFKSVYFPGQ